ncbi:4-hydroxythreonine-4-phosphate dehydrogenase PdxA [Arenicella sp. 4NH20-0111]|uniref:4-hydroxythreonine-4-phosphate dehydrogenase PdxA n=1 Tax=Arenicella sp. 4NH20-0111 TaxID=3127648 RepID=UPI003106A614
MKSKPIAYTLGEPAGIGPDILIQLAQHVDLSDVVVLGDKRVLFERAEQLKLDVPSTLQYESIDVSDFTVAGEALVDNVPGVLAMLDRAIDGCLGGEFSAMVTGPLHKGIINEAGFEFSGHTEYLAERTDADLPVMLLATDSLRVALVTTHLPLRDVADAITEDLIVKVCNVINSDLKKKYGIVEPRILICGLNPHAGEGGHLGREEIDIIEPALDVLRAQGVNIVGPLPADTLFTPKYLQQADVAIAMYHDQGLPVLKSQGFGKAANITLGLPIVRTSVDHGTAFDMAGSGLADTGSLRTAISVARDMAAANATSI